MKKWRDIILNLALDRESADRPQRGSRDDAGELQPIIGSRFRCKFLLSCYNTDFAVQSSRMLLLLLLPLSMMTPPGATTAALVTRGLSRNPFGRQGTGIRRPRAAA